MLRWWTGRQHRRRAEAILTLARTLRGHDQAALRHHAEGVRWRAWSGPAGGWAEAADRDAAFALVCETLRRHWGFELHVEQVWGALAMQAGRVVQMQTGEGKTATALLLAASEGFSGRGVHVLTANDYLASRDAELARPVLAELGLRVGCVTAGLRPSDRREAYQADVTYATAREVGFDHLRDCLAKRRAGAGGAPGDVVHRPWNLAVVDEADSLLIDEGRTPLLIATRVPLSARERALAHWSVQLAGELRPEIDYRYDRQTRGATLTTAGALRLLQHHRPPALEGLAWRQVEQQLEQSLTARLGFARDRQYVVREGEVAIVDESTGRVLEGRRWQQGLQQAVEAQEGLAVNERTETTARITLRGLFAHYPKLAGLTGTAVGASREFRNTFDLRVEVVPTHRPCLRQQWPERVFLTLDDKRRAVAREVTRLRGEGRAVLIGTPSVAASEGLERVLRDAGLVVEVLNCRAHAREAEIIAQAGQPGRVTIATNMAGRGTDIRVAPEVLARGGLHVLATERHTSRRIDDQLVGRTSRQGEPGSCQFWLSLEDELLAQVPG
ncbi:MAG: DEAD/DEAH box helicase, partial [Planctomycetaceae bacterium]